MLVGLQTKKLEVAGVEWSKLKNIIILILLLVNLFLLAMTGVQERDSVQYQEQALADAVTVLEKNGIHISAETIPTTKRMGFGKGRQDGRTGRFFTVDPPGTTPYMQELS